MSIKLNPIMLVLGSLAAIVGGWGPRRVTDRRRAIEVRRRRRTSSCRC